MPAWASFRAPVSAVALNQNMVTFNVLSTTAGQAARAWFEPPGVVSIQSQRGAPAYAVTRCGGACSQLANHSRASILQVLGLP